MILWRKLRYRFRKKTNSYRRKRWKKPKKGILTLLLSVGILLYGVYRTEQRIGPLAQEVALSYLNSELIREINIATTEALEAENIKAGSILQEDKDADGTIENIVTDYTAANRVKTAIAVRVAELMEHHRTVLAEIPAGAFFSDTLLTGFGVPVPLRIFSTHLIDIQFLDTFDSAGINQTKQQLSLMIKVPVRIAGIFSSQEGVVSTEVPLAESVIIGTVPQTYVSMGD